MEDIKAIVGKLSIKQIAKSIGAKNYVDKNWIGWKLIDNEWVGKRCVSAKQGFRVCWLEDVPKDEIVHKYLCGEDADYDEVIYSNKRKCNCWLEIDTCYCKEDKEN